MRELVTTNDRVLLSYVQVLLKDAGIDVAVFDDNMSAVQGTLGAVAQRLAVPEERAGRKPASFSTKPASGQWIAR
jgi:hypothetical protein